MRQFGSLLARRPATSISFLSLLTPAFTFLIRLVYVSSFPLGRVVAIVLIPVALFPIVTAIGLIAPSRYVGNPRFGRIDLALGPVTMASAIFLIAPTVLAAIAMQDPANRAFELAAALVCAVAAGSTNRFSRSRWPSAWMPVQLHVAAQMPASLPSDGGTDIRIRPRRGAIATLIVVCVAIGLMLVWAAAHYAPADLGFGLVTGVLGIGSFVLAALCTRLEAGCDETQVWYTSAVRRQTANRSALASFSWARRPSTGGVIRLIDAYGASVLSIPTLAFLDEDLKRLIAALRLPAVT